MAASLAVPFTINGTVKMTNTYLQGTKVKETKSLISELCHQFYHLRWVSGTVKVHDDSIPKPQQLIAMSPSGVQKERMMEEDMYVLAPSRSFLLAKPWPNKPPKCSDCGPLLLKTYEMRDAGAVIHSHGMESCIVTMINPLSEEFRAECYHYIFDVAIKLRQLGLDWPTPSHGPVYRANGFLRSHQNLKASAATGTSSLNNGTEPSRRCIVLDIEGTTTPITFVTDVLFPYARESVGKHLELTYDTAETQHDIKLLRGQVEEDLEKGVVGAVPIPADGEKEDIIAALVANVEAMIKADRKITSLKELQGHIWQTGFQNNELETIVYDDVPEALEKWHSLGIKVYIYSSGSRLAQRLLFGNTNYGDLRKYLCGFFDTTVGNKRETKSYKEITASLGVDDPSEILFVTDVYQEATAAEAAGLEVIISIRPGNGALLDNHGFKTVTSFSEI